MRGLQAPAHRCVMHLGEAVSLGYELEARCRAASCGARTPLSPLFFAKRYGGDFAVEDVSKRVRCMACGAADPEIRAVAPTDSAA